MPVRSERVRWAFQLLAAVAPQRIKHAIYRRILGWNVHPTARFGLSLIAVDRFSAAEGVVISHLNVIKGCDEVRLGVRAVIGPLNWITSPPRAAGLFPSSPGRRPGLVLEDEAAITTRHVLSCVDEVVLEAYAILGGLQSRIVTHGPNYVTATMETAPVRIGHHSLVTTSCTLLAGSSVPPRCIVAAGATVPGPLSDELAIYGGTPARKLKDLPEDAVLFTRKRGRLFD